VIKMWELACLRKRWTCCKYINWQTAIAGKPAPTLAVCTFVNM